MCSGSSRGHTGHWLGPGEKIKQLLREHGSFQAVEVMIERYQKTSLQGSKEGGWVTKHYLAAEKHWTK